MDCNNLIPTSDNFSASNGDLLYPEAESRVLVWLSCLNRHAFRVGDKTPYQYTLLASSSLKRA